MSTDTYSHRHTHTLTETHRWLRKIGTEPALKDLTILSDEIVPLHSAIADYRCLELDCPKDCLAIICHLELWFSSSEEHANLTEVFVFVSKSEQSKNILPYLTKTME